MDEGQKRDLAWIGDAVLALFARQWILAEPSIAQQDRSEAFIRLTANQFLSSRGEPTAVEAEIGRIYQRDGLQAAFHHIESSLLPLFKKQWAKARRPGSYRDRK